MVVATFFFSVLTIATAYSQDLTQLLWLRFISGIGLGCIIPQATALVGEFSPKKSRVTLMMCITVGFTVGAAIGGFVAAWLIPAFGWRSVFIFGGGVPLVIAVAMATSLPESLQFLAVRRKNTGALVKWLRQLDPKLVINESTVFVANEGSKAGCPSGTCRTAPRPHCSSGWSRQELMMLYSLSNCCPLGAGLGYRADACSWAPYAVCGTIGRRAGVISRGAGSCGVTLRPLAAISIAFIGQPGISWRRSSHWSRAGCA